MNTGKAIGLSYSQIFSNLKRIIEQDDTIAGRALDIFIQGLIILSLITFSLETLPNLSEGAKNILNTIEVFTVMIFTIEYILRVLVSDTKLKFIFSFYGLVDLFAILPFYVVSGLDTRALRSFRLLRLFRTFKLVRYNNAIIRFHKAFMIAKEEIVLFMSFSCLILYFAAVGIYYFENPAQPEAFSSIFDCLWWSVCTLTTVGYGDIYPITAGGRIFTFVILMVGLGIVAIPTGMLSSALTRAAEEKKELA